MHNALMDRRGDPDQAARLREARELAGYSSAREAAENHLRMPYGTYIGHENGHRGFTAKEARNYAKKYKVNLLWLVFGIGDARTVSLDQKISELPEHKQREIARYIEFVESKVD